MILYGSWVRLPLSTRNIIAAAFAIPKTSSTHVADNRVVQDGYQVHDIERLMTIEAMQDYTDSTSKDAIILFDKVVAKAEGRAEPMPVIIALPTDDSAPVQKHPAKKAAPKRGRKPKKA